MGIAATVVAVSDLVEQRRTFPADVESPRHARRWLVEVLADWGAEASPADLLLSELATNAVVHARSGFEVSASLNGTLRVAVADADAEGRPIVRASLPTAERGRGLALVTALSARWGVTPTEGGKQVWFEL
jgi:hypothetical protein